MPILAVSGEYKFLRYVGQDVDAVYIKGVKAYGKNLWCFANSGANDYGSNTVEAMDNLSRPQHYKFTVTSIASNIWSRLFQGLCPAATVPSYDINKQYTTSYWIKPSLGRMRIYVYLGKLSGSGNTNLVSVITDFVPNEWNFFSITRTPAGTDSSTSNANLVGFRYYQADHIGVDLIGQTVEIKDVKLEEGSLSPYSINSTLL